MKYRKSIIIIDQFFCCPELETILLYDTRKCIIVIFLAFLYTVFTEALLKLSSLRDGLWDIVVLRCH
jgi:hypothetical protein